MISPMRGAVASVVALGALLLLVGSAPAAFPGNNGKIAWSSARGGNFDVYSENPDGSGLAQLTTNTSSDVDPAWSADGTRIAFTSTRTGNSDIFVMAENGTGQTRVTDDPGNDVNPAWSPGGRNIVFSSNRDGNAEIFVTNDDGTSQTQLTHTDGASNAVPAWSPDGLKIAFTSTRDGRAQIYVMNVDGSNQTRLTNDPGNDVSPSWSPDGKRIAFASDRDGSFQIYSMNADGSDQRRLTTNLETDIDPAWSPDGKQIVYVSNRDSNREIYVMNADGSSQTRFTASPQDDTTPDWQALPIKPPPPPALSGAGFVPRWHQSRFHGFLVVAGDSSGPARIQLVLRTGSAIRYTTTLVVPAGLFHRSLTMPKSLLPGAYVLDAGTKRSPTELTPVTKSLRLRAPPEGVVSRAWASDIPGGPPMVRIPPSSTKVFAHFRFAALPRPGHPLVTTWYGPPTAEIGPPRLRPRRPLVIAFIDGQGSPVPSGEWTCVLRAGPTIVKRLSFHVG